MSQGRENRIDFVAGRVVIGCGWQVWEEMGWSERMKRETAGTWGHLVVVVSKPSTVEISWNL